MTYSIQALAKLAGVSPRTLRYYDQIGLLSADRDPHNGYRTYPAAAVDRLQLIRYFQLFGFTLTQIQSLLAQSPAAQTAALQEQRTHLVKQRDQLTALLTTLDRTLAARNGGHPMTDSEKFAAFKQDQLTANAQKFGAEVRQRYGDATFTASQAKFANLSEADYQRMQATEQQLFDALRDVCQSGDLTSPVAQHIYTLHRDWLCFTWNNYSIAAHRGLAQLYQSDARFAQYYNDRVGSPQATSFLVAAILQATTV